MYVTVPDERRNAFATALLVMWATMLPGVVIGALAGASIAGSGGMVFGLILGTVYGLVFGVLHAVAQLVALATGNASRHRRRSGIAATVVTLPVGLYAAFVLVTNGVAAGYASLPLLHAVASRLLVPRFALPPRHRDASAETTEQGPWHGPASPRRSHAPWISVRWHAVAFGLGGAAAAVAAARGSGTYAGFVALNVLIVSTYGFVAGLATGLLHAAVQAVLSRRLRRGEEHPARELAAVVTSFALALLTLTYVALGTAADDGALAVSLACCAAYVALTWPAARRAFRAPGDRVPRRS
jgi:hypothetical protein